MACKYLNEMTALLIFISMCSMAYTLPEGESLKELAEPETLIGSVGRIWDVGTSNRKAREIYQGIYLREFNAVTVL